MQKPQSWKRSGSEIVTDCRVFRVRRDACVREGDGKESDFFVIESPDWVNVIALTAEDEIVLIEQFRQGTADIQLELPSGIIDEGEEPMTAAKRELAEETGFTSNHWEKLGEMRPNPAIQDNTIHHFLARGCRRTAEISLDENESIVTKLFPRADVNKLVREKKIEQSLVLAALYYLETL